MLLRLLPALLMACGGDRCGNNPNPPFTVTPSTVDSSVPVPVAVVDAAISASPVGGGPRLEHGALVATAPEGGVFVAGLFVDLDRDGKEDLLAAAARTDAKIAPDLLYFPGQGATLGAPKLVQAAPKWGDITAEGCVPSAQITALPEGARADVGVKCTSGVGRRQLAFLLGRNGEASVRAALVSSLLEDPFTVTPRFEDRDSDGTPDLAFDFTVGKKAVTIAYIDRAGGLIADRSEPAKSFTTVAAAVRTERSLQGTKDLASVYLALCGPKPSLSPVVDGGQAQPAGTVNCGDRTPVDINVTLALSALAIDPLAAVQLYERAAAEGATAADEKLFAAALAKVATKKLPAPSKYLLVSPDMSNGRLSYAPITFGAAGELLVREESRTMRIDPANDGEAIAPGVPEWPRGAMTADGAFTWMEGWDGCDGQTVRGTLVPEKGADTKDPTLPVVPRLRPKACGSRGVILSVVPLRADSSGLFAYADGELVKVSAPYTNAESMVAKAFFDGKTGGPPGSALSQDGSAVVVPSRFGALVRRTKVGSSAWMLVPLGDAKGGPLSHCVVNNGATAVACVQQASAGPARVVIGHF